MNLINAIAKVRFSAAKPQRVNVHKGWALHAELLCLEPGQEIKVNSGEWSYYVITGMAAVSYGSQRARLAAGQFFAFAPSEGHTITASNEKRLVLLAIFPSE